MLLECYQIFLLLHMLLEFLQGKYELHLRVILFVFARQIQFAFVRHI